MTRPASALPLLAALACGSAASGAPPAAATTDDSSTPFVIRYELGGALFHPIATTLPRWTLYSDGLVVWTEADGEPTPGFAGRVMLGYLTEADTDDLLKSIEEAGFWQLDAAYRPGPRSEAGGEMVRLDPAGAPDQAWSRLTVRVADRSKQVSVYPAGWEGAPDAWVACTARLEQLEPRDAREFEPLSFRLKARPLALAHAASPAPAWPLAGLELPGPSEQIELTRDEGRTLLESIDRAPSVVIHKGQAFEVFLFGEPPRTR